jgi:hypothetical protein
MRPSNPAALSPDLEFAQLIGETYDDPLGFVELTYPWGEPGELAGFKGPDRWQREFLEELGKQVRERGFDGIHAVAPIRRATASGHGIGKSTLVAWIVNWIMSTRPHCQGTITANTYAQLETKTWAAILKWTRLCATSPWFLTTGTRIYHREHPQTWFCSAQSWRPCRIPLALVRCESSTNELLACASRTIKVRTTGECGKRPNPIEKPLKSVRSLSHFPVTNTFSTLSGGS